MILLHLLLNEIPTEVRDPDTKERYAFPLFLHVLGQVVMAVLELLMAIVAIDISAGDAVPAYARDCLAEGLADGLMILVPSIWLLITGLLYSGLLVER